MTKRAKLPLLTVPCIALVAILKLTASVVAATPDIVEDGEPKAAIVIAAENDRPRMATIAALELQHYLEEISGARCPILTKPDDQFPVTIYVGQSDDTERLGVPDEGLKFGAYRHVSGPNYAGRVEPSLGEVDRLLQLEGVGTLGVVSSFIGLGGLIGSNLGPGLLDDLLDQRPQMFGINPIGVAVNGAF